MSTSRQIFPVSVRPGRDDVSRSSTVLATRRSSPLNFDVELLPDDGAPPQPASAAEAMSAAISGDRGIPAPSVPTMSP